MQRILVLDIILIAINIIFYVRDQVIPQGKQTWQGLIKMHLMTIKDRASEAICWDTGAVLEESSAFTLHKIMRALLAVQQRELPASSGRFPRRICQGGRRGSCHQRTVSQLSPLLSFQSLQTQSLLSSHRASSRARKEMSWNTQLSNIFPCSPLISTPLLFLQPFTPKVKKPLLHTILFYHFRSF